MKALLRMGKALALIFWLVFGAALSKRLEAPFEQLVYLLAGFLAFYGREVFDWCVDAVKDWKRRRDWENRNR